MRVVFAGVVTVLLVFAPRSLLLADTIQPTVTYACTLGGVATPCANVPVLFQTFVNGNPRLGPGVFTIDWSADADATSTVLSPTFPFTASVQVVLSATAYTAGPVRPGFAIYSLGTDGDSGGGGGFTAFAEFDGVSCSSIMCGKVSPGQVPFTLGVPFQLEIIAGGSVEGQPGSPSEGGGGGGEIQLQLFDQNFNPVEILNTVPEPGPFAPVAAVLCVAVWWLRRKQSDRRD